MPPPERYFLLPVGVSEIPRHTVMLDTPDRMPGLELRKGIQDTVTLYRVSLMTTRALTRTALKLSGNIRVKIRLVRSVVTVSRVIRILFMPRRGVHVEQPHAAHIRPVKLVELVTVNREG